VLQRAIEIDPKSNMPYGTLALAYLSSGDKQQAVEIIKQGLKAIPDDPQLLQSLAGIHEANKEYDAAITTYEELLKKAPENAVAANNLATLLVDHKGDEDSVKQAKALAMRFESSDQPPFMDTLGWVYYKAGESAKAVAMLSKVVAKAPKVSVFQYHLGMAYHKAGDDKSAKIHLGQAVQAKTDFPGIDDARQTLATLK
jgi:Tfp pilus assembly protein PilF